MDERLFRRAAAIRQFEERLLDLFSEGKLSGTVHTCIGQELCALAVIESLTEGDWIFSNHRCHGHYLARSEDIRGLLAEIMGRPDGICAGRGGSQHIFRDRFLSNGVQGGGMPIAAGCALGLSKSNDSDLLAVAFIGDGTLGQGVVYETLNLAGKLKVPLLVVVENNGYAQSTNTNTTISGSIRERFEAFGWRYWETDIWQEAELFAKAREAIEFVRGDRTPAALCIDCYRLKAHSKGDDNRESAEISSFLERDPIQVFSRDHPEAAARIYSECATLMDEVVGSLNGHSLVPPPIPATHEPKRSSVAGWKEVSAQPSPQRVVERLRSGLKSLLETDEKVVVFGEDVEDPYGGAFKVTKGLSTAFPNRVFNTPISEAAIVGLGNGLALAGLRPIVEIMFGDFVTLAADQLINQASKFSYMYNQQAQVPVIVRTPMGGKRGYGATHSQSLEKHFLGVPGLNVVAINSVFDPALLLQRIHEHLKAPCLVVENKLLYTVPVHHLAADGRHWRQNNAPFPTLKLDASGRGDITIVCYGGMVEDVEAAVKMAFLQHEILAEVLVPTMIYPLDIEPIVESVSQTGRLLVVEEGQGFAGFGAEVLALCSEKMSTPPLVMARVAAAQHPIPCSRDLEKSALPDATRVLEAIQQAMRA